MSKYDKYKNIIFNNDSLKQQLISKLQNMHYEVHNFEEAYAHLFFKVSEKDLQLILAPFLRLLTMERLRTCESERCRDFRADITLGESTESYLARQGQNTVFGTEHDAQALAEALNLNLYMTLTEPNCIPFQKGALAGTMCLHKVVPETSDSVHLYNQVQGHYFVYNEAYYSTEPDGNCLYNGFSQHIQQFIQFEQLSIKETTSDKLTLYKHQLDTYETNKTLDPLSYQQLSKALPQDNAVLAILTRERYNFWTQDLAKVNVDAIVNQVNFEASIDSIVLEAENCHLIFDGGHGQANTTSGRPQLLNDQHFSVVEEQVRILASKGFTFKSIHLSSCFSASFIPLFRKLLTDNGVIFCQTLSSTDNASKLFSTGDIERKDLFSIGFAALAYKIDNQRALAGDRCFLSDSIYTREDDTLHRFRVDDPTSAFKAHNFIINAIAHGKEDKGHLFAIENYLFQQGISVDDRFTCIDGLEEVVRTKSFPTTLRAISEKDLNKITALEKVIFPDESPLDLGSCHNEKYSWLVHEKHVPQKILSYIFITENGLNELFINNLGTLPSARGKGLANRLLQQAIKQADQENKYLRLRVRASNSAALTLYKKLGFLIEGSDLTTWLHMKRNIDRSFYPQAASSATEDKSKGADSLHKETVTSSIPSSNVLPEAAFSSTSNDSSPEIVPSSDVAPDVVDESSTFFESPKPEATDYGFFLKALTVSLSLCLLCAAVALFPPLGILAGLGLVLTPMTGYAASAFSAVAGGLGFFSAFKSNKEDAESPAHTGCFR